MKKEKRKRRRWDLRESNALLGRGRNLAKCPKVDRMDWNELECWSRWDVMIHLG